MKRNRNRLYLGGDNLYEIKKVPQTINTAGKACKTGANGFQIMNEFITTKNHSAAIGGSHCSIVLIFNVISNSYFNNHFLYHFRLVNTQLGHVSVLWVEDGKIAWTKVKGRRTKFGNYVVECGIGLFAIGFGLGQVPHGEAGDLLIAFQEVLNIYILTMRFITVLVCFLGGVF